MIIYQHVEHVARELDSKLLLATLAASRGHEIVISDTEAIEKGIKRKILPPGIFHTKSLTPSEKKIERHQSIIDAGSIVTSIDEEGGLVGHGYDQFAENRYSIHTTQQASAIFCWGSEDENSLKKIYPESSSKIHLTGSPRVDLWKSEFTKYWGKPYRAPKRPFLLVVSNMSYANYALPFHKIVSENRKGGHFKRDPNLFLKNFGRASGHFQLTAAFIEALQHLSKKDNEYDIVLRPHPNENLESWRIYLQELPNIIVNRDGAITSWVNNAFAIMHNGCTTALEATVSNKPIITYVPFRIEHGDNELPNELGQHVGNKYELKKIVDKFFIESKLADNYNSKTTLPSLVSRKIFIDENELSARKIIKVWEELDNKYISFNSNINIFKFRSFLNLMKINGFIGNLIKKLIKPTFKKESNFKFPPFDERDIINRVNKLQKVLGIEKKIECKLLSERTILIK